MISLSLSRNRFDDTTENMLDAINFDDVEVVKRLCFVHDFNIGNDMALLMMRACEYGSMKTAKWFLELYQQKKFTINDCVLKISSVISTLFLNRNTEMIDFMVLNNLCNLSAIKQCFLHFIACSNDTYMINFAYELDKKYNGSVLGMSNEEILDEICKRTNGDEKIKIDMLNWIVEKGNVNLHKNSDLHFIGECMKGYVDTAKYFYPFVTKNINYDKLFYHACATGYIDMAKYIYSIKKVNVHFNNGQIIIDACKNGRVNIVEWLYGEIDKFDCVDYGELFKYAVQWRQVEIIKLLHSFGKYEYRLLRALCFNREYPIIELLCSFGKEKVNVLDFEPDSDETDYFVEYANLLNSGLMTN